MSVDVKTVSPDFAVAGQVLPGDVAGLAGRGFATLICARPDGEEPGQPPAAAIRAAAEAAGIEFHHIPVSGGSFPDEAIAAFGKARRAARGKVLGYCRTGTRAVTLDALANSEGLSADTLIERAKAAGYDLTGIRDRL